jgi:hypothetical protein
MSNLPGENVARVAQIFMNLGAPEAQAKVMAAQLLKRASQIAQERNISEVEAVETLLKQVIAARQGA